MSEGTFILNPEEGVPLRRSLGDGRIVDLMPGLLNAQLKLGPEGEKWYSDIW